MTHFPGARIITHTEDDYDSQHRRRRHYRHYPFDALLPNGTTVGGSSSAVVAPMHEVNTGLATATPQARCREACEQFNFTGWPKDTFGGSFWEHSQYVSCYVQLGIGNASLINTQLAAGIYLAAPGLPNVGGTGTGFWFDPPPANFPMCALMYFRDSVLAGANERFVLVTAIGDGVTGQKHTVLTGVDPPRSPISPGTPCGQRYELIYKPGEYVAARIDGVEGARHTDTLPNPATTLNIAGDGVGIGVYANNCQINDTFRASFYTLMAEMYRDY